MKVRSCTLVAKHTKATTLVGQVNHIYPVR
jgi:hypothetical protein